jgi:hypothetical protein
MISTVTTSTVSAVTVAGSLAIFGIVILLGLLVQKELVSAYESKRAANLRNILNIGIIPLLIAFVLVVISKVVEVLK